MTRCAPIFERGVCRINIFATAGGISINYTTTTTFSSEPFQGQIYATPFNIWSALEAKPCARLSTDSARTCFVNGNWSSLFLTLVITPMGRHGQKRFSLTWLWLTIQFPQGA